VGAMSAPFKHGIQHMQQRVQQQAQQDNNK
jgi:hypothetical protein